MQLFFGDITSDIVEETNIYSVEKLGRSINVTEKDIEEFIAIHIIIGVVKMPSYLDYWSSQLRYLRVAEIMPLKKYQQIRRFMHFTKNSEESTDRFHKIRPVGGRKPIQYRRDDSSIQRGKNRKSLPIQREKAKKMGIQSICKVWCNRLYL